MEEKTKMINCPVCDKEHTIKHWIEKDGAMKGLKMCSDILCSEYCKKTFEKQIELADQYEEFQMMEGVKYEEVVVAKIVRQNGELVFKSSREVRIFELYGFLKSYVRNLEFELNNDFGFSGCDEDEFY